MLVADEREEQKMEVFILLLLWSFHVIPNASTFEERGKKKVIRKLGLRSKWDIIGE